MLAIIVILAIIAVITVPIILNIIDNAKKGVVKDSAYGYKDAISKFYVSKSMGDPNYDIPDGTYAISDLDTLGVIYDGKGPDSNSWIIMKNNNVLKGCLQFDEYNVVITGGNVGDAIKGECDEAPLPRLVDGDSNGTISLGDIIKLGDEEFYALSAPADGKVLLITKFALMNLNNDQQIKQGTSASNVERIAFSSSNYWYANGSFKEEFSEGLNNYKYIYTRDNRNYLYSRIEEYKKYLVDQGFNIIDARLLSNTEAVAAHVGGAYDPWPDFMTNQSYWTGYAYYGGGDYVMSMMPSTGYFDYYLTYSSSAGLRPVIEIYESDVVIPE